MPQLATAPTSITDAHWFGESHRRIAGRADTRYGWLDTPAGPCIVKALDVDLAAYSVTLLHNEREVLRRLLEAGAPVPRLVAWPQDAPRDDWLVTRFAGMSLQVLRQAPGGGLAFEEWLSAWVHFLQRAKAFDDAGAVPIDLWAANLVLPLTDGIEGHAQLNQPVLIDHAHTVVAGMNLRRPVWMDRHMRRVAPELRQALQTDQEALISDFALARAELPGHESPLPEAHERTRRLWAEYNRPQQLQRLLDAGKLDRAAAIQYAVAVAISTVVQREPHYVGSDAAARLAPVLDRMQAEQPQARFDSLAGAARALRQVLRALPLVSERRFGPVSPADLLGARGQSDPAKREETRHWPTAMPEPAGTPSAIADAPTAFVDGGGTRNVAPDIHDDIDDVIDVTTPPGGMLAPIARIPRAVPDDVIDMPVRRSSLWLYLVAAAGAATGVLLPTLW